MKAKLAWSAIVGLILCLAIGMVWFLSSRTDPDAEVPDWVNRIREGKEVDFVEFDSGAADQWLNGQLHPGETTREEVFELFGDPRNRDAPLPRFGSDLDRPERDEVESFQYVIWYGDNVNWSALGVDFDRETGKLLDFGIGHCICGFCPHVLAHDGERWRLEGKMLAGCVGEERAGRDLLVLPRLLAENGVARVQLANWAPEIEELRNPELLSVALGPEEALDVDHAGEPVVWKAAHEVQIADLGASLEADLSDGDLLVLELKNTTELETYLRSVFLDSQPDHTSTDLIVDFGEAGAVSVPAVGTKFLRRVAVPIPAGATDVRFRGHRGFWYSRRAWIGTQVETAGRSKWHSPIDPGTDELQLGPMETADLHFAVDRTDGLAFALRLRGFYEFRNR